LVGDQIPLGGRILAVVDAYIAIRDERVYSQSHTHEEAIAELRRSSGSHFDPEIVDIFCKTITG
jgi:putative two-component system response regulator